jgi:hypothetical protein
VLLGQRRWTIGVVRKRARGWIRRDPGRAGCTTRHGRRVATTGVTGIRPGLGDLAGDLAAVLRGQAPTGLWRHSARSAHLRARADGYGCGTVHILLCTVPHPPPQAGSGPASWAGPAGWRTDQRAGGWDEPGSRRPGTGAGAPGAPRRSHRRSTVVSGKPGTASRHRLFICLTCSRPRRELNERPGCWPGCDGTGDADTSRGYARANVSDPGR